MTSSCNHEVCGELGKLLSSSEIGIALPTRLDGVVRVLWFFEGRTPTETFFSKRRSIPGHDAREVAQTSTGKEQRSRVSVLVSQVVLEPFRTENFEEQ